MVYTPALMLLRAPSPSRASMYDDEMMLRARTGEPMHYPGLRRACPPYTHRFLGQRGNVCSEIAGRARAARARAGAGLPVSDDFPGPAAGIVAG